MEFIMKLFYLENLILFIHLMKIGFGYCQEMIGLIYFQRNFQGIACLIIAHQLLLNQHCSRNQDRTWDSDLSHLVQWHYFQSFHGCQLCEILFMVMIVNCFNRKYGCFNSY